MLIYRRATLSGMSPVPIYTHGWRETMWGKVSCPRKQNDGRDWASNHRPSDLKSNALTTTPPRSPLKMFDYYNFTDFNHDALEGWYDQEPRRTYERETHPQKVDFLAFIKILIHLQFIWILPEKTLIVKLQISNHKLTIETGRFDKISRCERPCKTMKPIFFFIVQNYSPFRELF